MLLLDEATSALDAESEHLVQKALDELIKQGGQTIIVIAHRLSTIRDANKIVVMEKGEIKEQGTHQELIQMDGVYRALIDRQLTNQKQDPLLTSPQKKEDLSKTDEESVHMDIDGGENA